MRLRVNWKLEGSCTLHSSDIGKFEGDDASVLEQATKAIKERLLSYAGPFSDRKVTVEVVKID